MIKRYPIAIERPVNNSAFGVIFPDIPGCFSAGDSFDEAIENAKEALEGFLTECCKDREPIPEASKIDKFLDFEEFDNHIWAYVEIDVSPYLGKAKKVNVTLPEYLIAKIDAIALNNPNYKTRSGFLAVAASHEINEYIESQDR